MPVITFVSFISAEAGCQCRHCNYSKVSFDISYFMLNYLVRLMSNYRWLLDEYSSVLVPRVGLSGEMWRVRLGMLRPNCVEYMGRTVFSTWAELCWVHGPNCVEYMGWTVLSTWAELCLVHGLNCVEYMGRTVLSTWAKLCWVHGLNCV